MLRATTVTRSGRTRLRRSIAALAVLAVGVAACGGDDDSSSATTAAPATEAPAPTEAPSTTGAPATTDAPDETTAPTSEAPSEPEAPSDGLPPGEYTIGYIKSESGSLAFAGVPSHLAAEALLEEINSTEALGEGVTLRFRVLDDETDQARGLTAAETLINDSDVVAVLCCSSSSVAGAVRQSFIDSGTPLALISAILPDATDGQYVFRAKPPSQTVYETLAPAADDAFEFETVVVTRTSDNDGMVQTAQILGDELEARGVAVTYVDLLSTDRDVSGLATQIIDLNPDGVFLGELATTLPLTIRELTDRGYEGPMFGTASMSNFELFEVGGPAMVGRPFSDTFFAGSTTPAMLEFVRIAGPKFDNNEPNSYAAEGYTALQVIIDGLRNAGAAGGEITRETVAEGIRAITELSTPMGEITMDAAGQGDVEIAFLLQWNAAGEVVAWDGTIEGLEQP